MEVPVSTPWHSLDESRSKVVVCNGYLHLLVPCIRITVAQQYHLIMVGEVVVRDGNSS
uniref:Uncharacterized protein n=1 Tax=Rhizophora mucronata TaxID=61149 RepID=A0A2P2IQI7_RHIMU